MKKIFVLTSILICLTISFVYGESINTHNAEISKIETNLYGFDYSKEELKKRLYIHYTKYGLLPPNDEEYEDEKKPIIEHNINDDNMDIPGPCSPQNIISNISNIPRTKRWDDSKFVGIQNPADDIEGDQKNTPEQPFPFSPNPQEYNPNLFANPQEFIPKPSPNPNPGFISKPSSGPAPPPITNEEELRMKIQKVKQNLIGILGSHITDDDILIVLKKYNGNVIAVVNYFASGGY